MIKKGTKNIVEFNCWTNRYPKCLLVLLLFSFAFLCTRVRAEAPLRADTLEWVALKNNLLYDAAATPNLQVEVRLAKHWSLEAGVGFNPFPLKDETFPKWRHISVSLAPRYWFCNVFNRDFVSVNVAYAHYNVAGSWYPVGWMYPQVKDDRYQGDAIMAGASYGWHFAISPHFSIELEAGVDAGYSWYDKFECKHCGSLKESGGRWVVLPKLGVNISIPLGGNQTSFAKRCDCELLDDKNEEAEDTIAADTIVADTTAAVAPVDTMATAPVEIAEEKASEEQPVDTVAAEQKDTIAAAPVVAAAPIAAVVPMDTVAAEQKDTVVAAPKDTVAAEPAMTKKGEPKERICDCMLRPGEPYRKYDIKTPLSSDSRNIFLYFEVYDTKLNREFLENNGSMDSLMHILAKVLADSTLRLERIQVVGFASFDGPLAPNELLAQQRALSIKKYIQSKFDLKDEQFIICNGGESWVEMRYMMENESFEGQADVFRIIDEDDNLDKNEARIKKLNNGQVYQYMKTNYRKILRNLGCITIYYEKY